MSAADTEGDEEAVRVSVWQLAALHTIFYLVCLVATLGLRSPLWLLVTLLYCGVHRNALRGRCCYPVWLWRVLGVSVALCAVGNLVANSVSLALRNAATGQAVWQRLGPLWLLLGVQQWRGEEWLDTVVLPAVTLAVFSVAVLVMHHLSSRGLRCQHEGSGTSTSTTTITSRARWWRRRLSVACRLAVCPALTLVAWAVAWLAPPSGVGLCLETGAFCFLGAALWAMRGTTKLSITVFAVVTHLFGHAVVLLVVLVAATHNAAFAPLSTVYAQWWTQMGLGSVDVRSEAGVRRALQLVGMVVVAAAATAAAAAAPHGGGAAGLTERTGLLARPAVEDEDGDGEGARGMPVSREAAAPPVLPSSTTAAAPSTGEERGGGGSAPERQQSDASVNFFGLSHGSGFPLRAEHVVQALAIACVMALLAFAVCFPSLVSLAVWLLHLCCCLGGVVAAPQQPPPALRLTLAVNAVVLGCAIVMQYGSLVLLSNPSTAAWVWPPALPHQRENSGTLAAQVIAEHVVVLCLGLYVSLQGTGPRNRRDEDNDDDDGDAAEVRQAPSSALPDAATPLRPPPPHQQETLEATADFSSALDWMIGTSGHEVPESPHRNWMFAQLRSAAGDPGTLRTLFETAVGRAPRSSELEQLRYAAQDVSLASFSSVRRLSMAEVFSYIASGPLYTYVIIVSLFVLGTSGSSMDALHASCLVLSLLYSIIGSNAVLYRRLRTLAPVWVAAVVGAQLLYHLAEIDKASRDDSSTGTAGAENATGWDGYLGLSTPPRGEAVPYLAVQLVLLWCCRYAPHPLTDWTRVWQCLVFRCRWTHVFHSIHRAAGFVVLLWIVLLLPRSVIVTVLVLLLFCGALFHYWRWHGLAYGWRRYCVVGYCGVVLLAMLLVEFAPMQPQLWHVLRALGCPAGAESACARDVGFPADATVWLTPLSLPWWFVIVLATAAGTPYALPTSLVGPSSPMVPTAAAAAQGAGWQHRLLHDHQQQQQQQQRLVARLLRLQSGLLTTALLAAMTAAALYHPSLLTAAYLVGPIYGICPTWTLGVAGVHTALQCTYQFWFSPAFWDTQTLWGASLAEIIGVWKASPVTTSTAATLSSTPAAPSTLTVAAAPLFIGLLQALEQRQALSSSAAAAAAAAGDSGGGAWQGSASPLSLDRSWRRLCASHVYVLLLLVLVHGSQDCALGWLVAALLLVVWRTADLRGCGVLLRPRWLHRLCLSATATVALVAYALLWAQERFPSWPVRQRFLWLLGSGTTTNLFYVCWTATAACVALHWSSSGGGGGSSSVSGGGEGGSSARTHDAQGDGDEEAELFTHPHSANLILWLRERVGHRRGMFGIHAENSIEAFTAAQHEALLADAAELCEPPVPDTESTQRTGASPVLSAAPPLSHQPHQHQHQQQQHHDSSSWGCALIVATLRLVPLAGCALTALGAAASPTPSLCVLSIGCLVAGLCLILGHARLQWSFWRWWRRLLLACAALPLLALLRACPPIASAMAALPPWAVLLIGRASDATQSVGAGLDFTLWHVALFFALWSQSCVYNNPQWGLGLLRLQIAERQRGESRHAALQQQLAARVMRAMAEATRVDREMQAYLAGLRAGDDATTDAYLSTSRALQRREEDEAEEGEAEGRREGAVSPMHAEMDARHSSRTAVPRTASVAEAVAQDDEGGGVATTNTSPLARSVTVTGLGDHSTRAAADAGGGGVVSSAPPPTATAAMRMAWLRWHQRCERGLRRVCNCLAAYTYHPSDHRVHAPAGIGATTTAAAAGAGGAQRDEDRADDGAVPAAPAVMSLWQLLLHTCYTALQAALRHTPQALLACVLVNVLLTGCFWELAGLCYLAQVALAYHPHAPRSVYRCYAYYVALGVLLKELVVLWSYYDSADYPVPSSWVAGILLPTEARSTQPWSSTPTRTSPLRYTSLWMDLVTFLVVVLHERVCLLHGVYVEGRVGSGPAPPSSTVTAVAAVSPVVGSPLTRTSPTFARPNSATNSSNSNSSSSGTVGVRAALARFYANVVSVPGVGEDWYISYTTADLLALFVLVITYSDMTANEKLTLQDNVQNNRLPGPMALLLCVSVLQLVADRMLYIQRCMRLKALSNWVCAVVYCGLYGWWRNAVAVSAHAAGNAYFSIKVVALVLSVTQVCRGYPVHRRRDAFTTHPGSLFHYSCFMVYRAIPFLWEVRTLIDWTVQHTALTLQEYLTLEDACVFMYHCRERYVTKQLERARVGDPVPRLMKWTFGVSRLALILLALLGPLLYYSTYNPSTVVNKATQVNLELSFFGAHDFFSTTVHDNTSTPAGWWSWLARTRPTLAPYGQMVSSTASPSSLAQQTVQLMEFTSCSGSQWLASPQAMRQVLAGLRTAAADTEGVDAAPMYIVQSIAMTRSAGSTTDTTAGVSLIHRWPIPRSTARAMVHILERETGAVTTTSTTTTQKPTSSSSSNSSGSSSGGGGGGNASSDSSGGEWNTTYATLPFFYSPFAFNRASRLDVLPTAASFPNRNRQHCTLELHHERDVALDSLVRYWCLQCTPLFPQGNVPAENTSTADEWRCLSTGVGCDAYNYENLNDTSVAAATGAPFYMVILSDSVVVGISFLKGIGIVALYTTFVLALGRLLRSVLSNKVGTLVFENMANPAALENMVRCIGIAREYSDLRLEHTIYLELVDLLRSPERLFQVTGSLRTMYVDEDRSDGFRLGQVVRRREVRRGVDAEGDQRL